MYCIKCGVELKDSEEKCPLCGTVVFHPDMKRPDGEKPYPAESRRPAETASRSGMLFITSIMFLVPFVLSLLCDWKVNGTLVWSGYAAGALALVYIIVVLPMWFRHATPVIFVAADFVAIGLYLLYIDFAVNGHWFLSFAFPVTGGAMLIACAAVTLLHYLRKGHLFVYAGTLIAIGGFAVLVEFLINITFHVSDTLVWSLYPLSCSLIFRRNAYRYRLLPQNARKPEKEVLYIGAAVNTNKPGDGNPSPGLALFKPEYLFLICSLCWPGPQQGGR